MDANLNGCGNTRNSRRGELCPGKRIARGKSWLVESTRVASVFNGLLMWQQHVDIYACMCVCNNRCVFIISMQIVLPVWLTPITSINRWFRSLQSTPHRSQDPNSFTIVLRPFTFAAVSIRFHSVSISFCIKNLFFIVCGPAKCPRRWATRQSRVATHARVFSHFATLRCLFFFLIVSFCIHYSFDVAKLPLLLFVINKLSNLQEAERLTTIGDLLSLSLSLAVALSLSFRDKCIV